MIKFALVVPCKNFIDVAFSTFREHNLKDDMYGNHEYVMEEVIVNPDTVDKVWINADVIITRGLFAEILQSIKRDIPVVEIPVPAIDLVRTINACVKKFGPRKIGAIGAYNMIQGVDALADLVTTPVRSYILDRPNGGPALVSQAIKDGCSVIIGGMHTCDYATQINVANLQIRTSRESCWQSITDAKRAAHISRTEQEKAGRLKAMLDLSRDGILSFDLNTKRIGMLNRCAEAMLGLKNSFLDSRIQDTPLPRDFKALLLDSREYNNEVLQCGDTMLNITKRFITVKNNTVGAMVNIQEVHGIQMLERGIRRKIYNQGHVAKASFGDVIAETPLMQKLIASARKFSRTDSNILLLGESGSGKEILAQSIHNHSRRQGAPFVAVNCAVIPESLLESELFGYDPGAFTGAKKNGKPGFFELAHNGTIFLDEIGELPLAFQAKLLRAIQEREIMRLGGHEVIPVDIRIIAATNQNIEEMVRKGTFRQDLFFRLDVLRLGIPRLCDRRGDIPPLAVSYLRRYFPGCAIEPGALQELEGMEWPGNVRHLHNFCERLAVLKESGAITAADVRELAGAAAAQPELSKEPPAPEDSEPGRIRAALAQTRYHRGRAARQLGMDRSTLWRKMREYDL